MAEVDLTQLLEGEAFTLPCTISNNGLRIKTTLLIDTEVNRYTFIDLEFAQTIQTFLSVSPTWLKELCKVQEFDRQQAAAITHYLELTLELDSHCI